MGEKGTPSYTTYRMDQEILDARGIRMTVQEVVTLPTMQYSERVHALNLAPDDLAFVKCLRRRIKNRLASQNSRKRNMEHLRRLSHELKAVRKFKGERETERECLLEERQQIYEKCRRLREFIQKNLKDKSAIPELPNLVDINIESQRTIRSPEDQRKDQSQNLIETRLYNKLTDRFEKRYVCAKTIFLNSEVVKKNIDNSLLVKELNRPIRAYENSIFDNSNNGLSIKQISSLFENSVLSLQKDKKFFATEDKTQPVKPFDKSLKQNGFENTNVADKVTSLFENKNVSSSVKQIYNSIFEKDNAQTIKQSKKLCDSILEKVEHRVKQSKPLCDSISEKNVTQSINQSMKLCDSIIENDDAQSIKQSDNYCDPIQVLNLSLKQGRKTHGRKQTAPRRLVIACNDVEDSVLDLKVKRDGQ